MTRMSVYRNTGRFIIEEFFDGNRTIPLFGKRRWLPRQSDTSNTEPNLYTFDQNRTTRNFFWKHHRLHPSITLECYKTATNMLILYFLRPGLLTKKNDPNVVLLKKTRSALYLKHALAPSCTKSFLFFILNENVRRRCSISRYPVNGLCRVSVECGGRYCGRGGTASKEEKTSPATQQHTLRPGPTNRHRYWTWVTERFL